MFEGFEVTEKDFWLEVNDLFPDVLYDVEELNFK